MYHSQHFPMHLTVNYTQNYKKISNYNHVEGKIYKNFLCHNIPDTMQQRITRYISAFYHAQNSLERGRGCECIISNKYRIWPMTTPQAGVIFTRGSIFLRSSAHIYKSA